MERNMINNNNNLNMDWGNLFDLPINKVVNNCVDALICSLNDKGRVDLEYMSEISNFSISSIIEELDGHIFQDPTIWNECWYQGYKTKEEYLSGDIFTKLNIAIEANEKYDGRFIKNINALKEIMPSTIPYKDIHYSIASAWMDKSLIIDFITQLFDGQIDKDSIRYIPETNKWVIAETVQFYNTANYTFGTSRINTKALILKILNHKEIRIYDPLKVDKKTTYKFNKEETVLALEKVEVLEKAFKTFIENYGHESLVEKAYNEKFRYVINRKYDGSFLNLPDLYDYQKDAVARIIFNKNTLLAHNVGAGKTFIMIAAGEELLRLGYSYKNLYVVPNNIIGQWEDVYRKMYPKSKLLVVYPKDYTIKTKDAVLDKIKNGNYDVVLTTYSVFDRFEHSLESEIQFLKSRISSLSKIKDKYYIKQHIDKYSEELKKKLKKLQDKEVPESLSFEELGFSRLFLDEAHNYKNISLECSKTHLGGIMTSGSTKCDNMLMSVDYLTSNGNGVIMATGTPITNSVTDIYVFQRYLQAGELKLLDIDTFDKWLSVFAEVTDVIEVDVDTTKYTCKSRINKFYNIDQLTVLLSNIADFCNPNHDKSLPKFNGYIDTVIERNVQFDLFLEDISKRVELIRKHQVTRDVDNLLKITVDGRLGALDIRLINESFIKPYNNKIDNCAKNVYDMYLRYPNTTQIIFCDLSIPKDTFNVYDELKSELIKQGIKVEEIAFIHDASTETKKKRILKEFNEGKIRVLIGSTFKLGTGVNVQEKLIAIHHLDVPWRPSDMMQREGRIIREGNTNEEVFIYRYIQQASFDAYSWQILERKAKIIRDMLANTLTEKETEDIEDTVLSYSEVKAIAVGNDKIKEHIELCNELSHIKTLAKKQNERYMTLQNEVDRLSTYVENLKKTISEKLEDKKSLQQNSKIIQGLFELYNFKDSPERAEEIRSFLESYMGLSKENLWFPLPGFEIIIPSDFLTKNKYLIIKGKHMYKSIYRPKTLSFGYHLFNDLCEGLYTYREENTIESVNTSIETIQNELVNRVSYDQDIKDLSLKIQILEGELGIYEQKPIE